MRSISYVLGYNDRIDAMPKKRPDKLKCKPGFEQRGAVCQPIKRKQASTTGGAGGIGGAIATGVSAGLVAAASAGVISALNQKKNQQAIVADIQSLRSDIENLQSQLPAKALVGKQALVAKTEKVSKQFNVKKAAAVTSLFGAALVGTPPAGYMIYRARYQNNFKKSAQAAKQRGEEIESEIPTDLKGGYRGGNKAVEAKQITLVVGGFAAQKGENSLQYAQQFAPPPGSGRHKELLQRAEDEQIEGGADLFEDHHVVAINNREFEIRGASERNKFNLKIPIIGQELTDGNVEQFRTMLGTSLGKGQNPVAINMAAQAYAFHKKHPDKPINLLGYSAGGMVTHEAAHILKEMGVKNIRVANFGSPYWGTTNKVSDSVTFASKNDPTISEGGVAVRDPLLVNDVANHFAYLQNLKVRRHLKNLFDGKVEKTESVWIPKLSKEPQDAPNPLKTKTASRTSPESPEEEARQRRQRKAAKREDPARQAELQRKLQERERRRTGGK
jgi:pimeloyl-ACP methyl ester carboxylesterase